MVVSIFDCVFLCVYLCVRLFACVSACVLRMLVYLCGCSRLCCLFVRSCACLFVGLYVCA